MDIVQLGLLLPTAEAAMDRARALGFELAEFSTSSGQQVWEWRRRDQPRPQFAAERVAVQWMAEWLERHDDESEPATPLVAGL